MLMLPPRPHDMPPMLQHHVLPSPSLNFHTPSTYHAYAPTAPSRYASETGTILTLGHPHLILSAAYHS
ncbi:hypothetical protein O181_010597 [Austropuccinia psidii MF-1]|uniref:Uncharacterized protein n=1 Tax=Austropuccinia psidii MF-1 TaxID=1389203 RepID=A0A9Q3BU12_9BASI|nr:hypothetical protein [Austropuccinia psidii MF-1]